MQIGISLCNNWGVEDVQSIINLTDDLALFLALRQLAEIYPSLAFQNRPSRGLPPVGHL